MLFIQFWMFSKDFSSVMSYTRMMPCHSEDRVRVSKEKAQQAEAAAPVAHHGSSVVGCRNGLEPLLPRCVPAHTRKSEKKWTAVTGNIKRKVPGVRKTERGNKAFPQLAALTRLGVSLSFHPHRWSSL